MKRTERDLTILVNFQRTWRTTPSTPGAGKRKQARMRPKRPEKWLSGQSCLCQQTYNYEKLAQHIKVPATKADGLSLILRTHMVGEDRILKVVP